MISKIQVRCEFEGFHLWSDAPDSVAFLRTLHRHIFHVTAELQVTHDNRELEFVLVKRDLQRKIALLYPDKLVGSCEMVARDIYHYLKSKYGVDRAVTVSVSEDGENGAVLCD